MINSSKHNIYFYYYQTIIITHKLKHTRNHTPWFNFQAITYIHTYYLLSKTFVKSSLWWLAYIVRFSHPHNDYILMISKNFMSGERSWHSHIGSSAVHDLHVTRHSVSPSQSNFWRKTTAHSSYDVVHFIPYHNIIILYISFPLCHVIISFPTYLYHTYLYHHIIYYIHVILRIANHHFTQCITISH